jgi:hypothetical protein
MNGILLIALGIADYRLCKEAEAEGRGARHTAVAVEAVRSSSVTVAGEGVEIVSIGEGREGRENAATAEEVSDRHWSD